MPSRPDGFIRAFGMSGLQITASMARIERDFAVRLKHDAAGIAGRKTSEYTQFEASLRSEAEQMSEFYELFYCLENSIRRLVADILIDAEGAGW